MSNDDVVDTLNDLIEISKDGEYGFQTSAEYLKDTSMRSLFERHAVECRQSVTELQSLVRQYGGEAEDSGTVAGAMHRGWVAMKGTLTGYSTKSILEEAERGEDTALSAYRKALDENLPADVQAVIEKQFEGVKRNHAQVRTLRDQARSAAV